MRRANVLLNNNPYSPVRTLTIVFAVCLFASALQAANHYVRASAAGSGNGSDWANAYKTLPASLIRGDTYYVAAGSYGSHTFNDPVSGTTPITIVHASQPSHGTDTGWEDSYAGQSVFTQLTFSTGYYKFDGATGGGPGSWSTGFGFAVKMPVSGGQSAAVYFGNKVTDITLEHTDFQGRGRRYSGGDTDLLYIVHPYTNITISHCYLHDTDRTMILTWPAGGSGFTLEYSYLARNGVQEHREAWSAGTDSNVTVRYNLFEDIMGTGFIALVNGNGTASNWNIYGNAFYWTGNYSDGIINTGVIVNRYDGGSCTSPAICVAVSNWHIYNNVIANIGGGSFTSAFDVEGDPKNYVVEDNIWFNNHTSGPSGAGNASVADYNWFYGNTKNNTAGPHDVVGSGNPFANWTYPLTTQGAWNLKQSIPGLALGAPYNFDWSGNVRGAGGVWDRGALQSVNGMAPPTDLHAAVQ